MSAVCTDPKPAAVVQGLSSEIEQLEGVATLLRDQLVGYGDLSCEKVAFLLVDRLQSIASRLDGVELQLSRAEVAA